MKHIRKEKLEQISVFIGHMPICNQQRPLMYVLLETENRDYMTKMPIAELSKVPDRIRSLFNRLNVPKQTPIFFYTIDDKKTIPPIVPFDKSTLNDLENEVKKIEMVNVASHTYQIRNGIPKGEDMSDYRF